jgi:hypothetical protein
MSFPRTMSAVLLTGHGGLEKLEYRTDVPVPRPGSGEVLIQVAAAGINNTDVNTRIGWYSKAVTSETGEGGAAGFDAVDDVDATWSGRALEFPRIQGADVCGHIVDVGEGVSRQRIGERVLVRNMLRTPVGYRPFECWKLMARGLIHEDAGTVNGRTIGENFRDSAPADQDVIRTFDRALLPDAGFLVLRGNLFDSAIMKTSGISPEFRERYLSDPAHPNVLEGRAIVFDGPEDYHARIDDPALDVDETCLLIIRGVGPLGYPGAAEVVNMQPPAALIKRGVHELPCIGDGRQSGTSGSPSILNASPEAAAGGGLALLQTGDVVRIDLVAGRADVLLSDEELADRRRRLEESGGYPMPPSQTPWQEIQRAMVTQLSDGMVLRPAVGYQRVARTMGIPRDNH